MPSWKGRKSLGRYFARQALSSTFAERDAGLVGASHGVNLFEGTADLNCTSDGTWVSFPTMWAIFVRLTTPICVSLAFGKSVATPAFPKSPLMLFVDLHMTWVWRKISCQELLRT